MYELLFPRAIAIDREGRILLAAETWQGGEQATLPGMQGALLQRTLITVIRYLPDGQLDPSFGQGGIAETDLGVPPAFTSEAPNERFPWPSPSVTSLTVDPLGRIVLAGTYTNALHPHCKSFFPEPTNGVFVGRLTANGTPDQAFAGGRAVTLEDLDYGDADVATGKHGQVILGTQHADGFYCGFPAPEGKGRSLGSLMRIGPAGGIDSHFSTNGVLNTEGSVKQVAVTGSGKILALVSLGDYSYPKPMEAEVLRLHPNGTFDRSFGKKGRAWLHGTFAAISPGGRGRVLAAGATGTSETPSKFLLVRLTRAGVLDRSINPAGEVVAGFGKERAIADSLAVDSRGRPVLAGTLIDPSAARPYPLLALARYLLPH